MARKIKRQVTLDEKYIHFINNKALNFSLWVRNKLDQEMLKNK